MWITNAGFADLFTVFAKVDGEKFTAFLVERDFSRLLGRRGRAQDGHSRIFHLPADSERLQGPGGKPAGRNRQGTRHRVQHPEHRPLQAGRDVRGRSAGVAGKCHRLRQAAQGVQQSDRRLRPGPRKDGQHGDADLCRRSAGLPHRRHDGRGARAKSTSPAPMRPRKPARRSRSTRWSAPSSRSGARR